MERFYDGDQEKLFAEAHVINPFKKGPTISRTRSSQNSLSRHNSSSSTEECGICFMTLPASVCTLPQHKHFIYIACM